MSGYANKLEEWEDLVNQGNQSQQQNGGLNQLEHADLDQVSREIQEEYEEGKTQARISGSLPPLALQKMQKMEQLYEQVQQLQTGIQGRGSGGFGQQIEVDIQQPQQQFGQQHPGLQNGGNQFEQQPGISSGGNLFGQQPSFQNGGSVSAQQSNFSDRGGGFGQRFSPQGRGGLLGLLDQQSNIQGGSAHFGPSQSQAPLAGRYPGSSNMGSRLLLLPIPVKTRLMGSLEFSGRNDDEDSDHPCGRLFRCKYCDKPQHSRNRRNDHEEYDCNRR